MADFTKYLSTAPVAAVLFTTLILGTFIEINRFFPDILAF